VNSVHCDIHAFQLFQLFRLAAQIIGQLTPFRILTPLCSLTGSWKMLNHRVSLDEVTPIILHLRTRIPFTASRMVKADQVRVVAET